jgi:hypothetical protein
MSSTGYARVPIGNTPGFSFSDTAFHEPDGFHGSLRRRKLPPDG